MSLTKVAEGTNREDKHMTAGKDQQTGNRSCRNDVCVCGIACVRVWVEWVCGGGGGGRGRRKGGGERRCVCVGGRGEGEGSTLFLVGFDFVDMFFRLFVCFGEERGRGGRVRRGEEEEGCSLFYYSVFLFLVMGVCAVCSFSCLCAVSFILLFGVFFFVWCGVRVFHVVPFFPVVRGFPVVRFSCFVRVCFSVCFVVLFFFGCLFCVFVLF